MSKKATPREVWPSSTGVNTGEIQGNSLIPVIWAIGAPKTGKSTFIATIDPVRPGEETRTMVIDMEGSMAALQHIFPMDIVDIRGMTVQQYGQEYTPKHLYEVWRDYMLTVPAGKYTVLGIDPVSDLKIGSNMWVNDNPSFLGKAQKSYYKAEYSWGDTNILWKQMMLELARKFQTVVLTSHVQDVFDKESGKRTGDKKAKSIDFSEIATLTLWFTRENNKLWAKREMSRLSHAVWGDEPDPRMADMLPLRLEPKAGQTYPALIRQYLAAPQPSYGELDQLNGYDPTVALMTDDERAALALEREKIALEQAMLENQAAVVKRKNEIVATLIADGLYPDKAAVGRAVQALGLTEQAKDLLSLDDVELALRDYASKPAA